MDCELPQVRSLITVRKLTCNKKQDSGPTQESLCHYVSSQPPEQSERFERLIRGHWAGSEIRNHWVRDALFEEDKTRSRNFNLNGNLAVLRCALISLKSRLAPKLSWPAIFEQCAMRPSLPIAMVFKNSFK